MAFRDVVPVVFVVVVVGDRDVPIEEPSHVPISVDPLDHVLFCVCVPARLASRAGSGPRLG